MLAVIVSRFTDAGKFADSVYSEKSDFNLLFGKLYYGELWDP